MGLAPKKVNMLSEGDSEIAGVGGGTANMVGVKGCKEGVCGAWEQGKSRDGDFEPILGEQGLDPAARRARVAPGLAASDPDFWVYR